MKVPNDSVSVLIKLYSTTLHL